MGFSQTGNAKKEDALLLGEIDKNVLTTTPYNTWFSKNYNDYLVNKSIVKRIKTDLKDYQVTVFMGSWCKDSKREVPRFFKLLDAANFPKKQLKVIAVDKTPDAYKQSPGGEEKGLNIHRVPNFIFYKDGKEVNRIVEFPKETFERDVLRITSGEPYTPNYHAVIRLHDLFKSKSIDNLKLETPLLVSELAESVKGSRELNTYGYTLLTSNQIDKALYVFDLNSKIFPYKHSVYDSLGEAHFKAKNFNEALINYYRSLCINPKNKDAENRIKSIRLNME